MEAPAKSERIGGDPEERVELAGARTSLSNERTLAAWWRTVMAALAAALAFAKLFGDAGPQWLVRGGATLLIVLALVMLAVAVRRYRRTARHIESESVDRVPRFELWLGTLLLALVSLAAGAVVWLPI